MSSWSPYKDILYMLFSYKGLFYDWGFWGKMWSVFAFEHIFAERYTADLLIRPMAETSDAPTKCYNRTLPCWQIFHCACYHCTDSIFYLFYNSFCFVLFCLKVLRNRDWTPHLVCGKPCSTSELHQLPQFGFLIFVLLVCSHAPRRHQDILWGIKYPTVWVTSTPLQQFLFKTKQSKTKKQSIFLFSCEVMRSDHGCSVILGELSKLIVSPKLCFLWLSKY